jgi:hypothetical protein
LRPHQKPLTESLARGSEINIDPQSIFRSESGNLLHDPADLIRRKEIKKKMRNNPVEMCGWRFPF